MEVEKKEDWLGPQCKELLLRRSSLQAALDSYSEENQLSLRRPGQLTNGLVVELLMWATSENYSLHSLILIVSAVDGKDLETVNEKVTSSKIKRLRDRRKTLLKNKAASDDLSELLSKPFELPLNKTADEVASPVEKNSRSAR
eukprot:scpid72753/ scgid21139/ 